MIKRVICILLLSSFFSSVHVNGAKTEDPDAANLVNEIKVKGAKAVMAELTADDEMTQFEKVCDKIETGKKEWLEVARLLLPGSDADTTESLGYSVVRALPKAPRRVLELIAATGHDLKWGFTVKNTCISTFNEPEPGVAEKYLMESEKALKSLDTSNDPKLDGLRHKCLKSIQADISYSKKHGLWKPKSSQPN